MCAFSASVVIRDTCMLFEAQRRAKDLFAQARALQLGERPLAFAAGLPSVGRCPNLACEFGMSGRGFRMVANDCGSCWCGGHSLK